MAKRLLRTALLCAVLVIPLTLTAFADTVTRMYGDYPSEPYYELVFDKSDGTVTGGERSGWDFALDIPSEIDGVPVRNIAPDAFCNWNCNSVTIPNDVVSIGKNAFKWCNLSSVTVPDSVVSIGEGAFRGCSRLKSAALPARLTKIEDNLFQSCGELRNVNIPDSVTEIGDSAFAGCNSLPTPRFPSGLTKIGKGAFYGLGQMKNSSGEYMLWNETLILPDSLKVLGELAFEHCCAITSVAMPGGLTDWGEYTFWECKNLTSAVISEGAKEIAKGAFYLCYALESVSFPSTLVAIREWAFGDTSIERVVIPEGVETIEDSAFVLSDKVKARAEHVEVFLPKSLKRLKIAFHLELPINIYYEGSQAQWKALLKAAWDEDVERNWGDNPLPEGVTFESFFNDEIQAKVHYNAAMPAQASAAVTPETPQPSADIPPEERGPFDDVRKSDYFCESVVWAVANGVTAGTSPTTFSPQGQCTRAHAIAFLWRACGSPDPEGANPYSDVPEGKYYAKAAIWAYERGLTEGGLFNGSGPCTRMMAVAWLWKLAGSPAAGESPFRDVSGVSAQAAAWASAQGVTNGTSETAFNPGGTCTRAQIVTFLYRAYNAGQLR